jgi:hypothetical protein
VGARVRCVCDMMREGKGVMGAALPCGELM